MIKSKGNEELKQKLIKLNSQTNYPSVTILYPVNQGTFGNGDNSEKLLKELLREADQKLSQSSFVDRVAIVKEKLKNLVETRKYDDDTKGNAIFVSSEIEEIIALPFEVESKAYVGYGFQVRDLVYAMNRLTEYVLVSIAEKKVLTLRGMGARLSPVEIEGMPTDMDDAGPEHVKDRRYTGAHDQGGGNESFIHQGVQQENAERMKNFLVKIDHALSKYLVNENLRFVVMGVERKTSHFKKLSKNLDRLICSVEGNYDHLSVKALGDLVWPEVQKKVSEEKEEHLKMLEAAIGRSQYASGITHAWHAAAEGRVKTLLVEKDFTCPAIVSDDGFNLDLEIDGKQTSPERLKEDAVDDLIELVLDKGGNIVFLEDGKLENHDHLAAITRY